MFHATLQVIRFELIRTMTVGRIVIWLGLCLFPALLVGILHYQSEGRVPDEAMAMICYYLVPQVSCMLGLLMWATPAIGSELESQNWIHLNLRPKGRLGVALGKYCVSVIWTMSYGLLSALLVSIACGVEEIVELWLALSGLVVLSSISYAALYVLIGASVFRRATVIAVVYSLVLEGFVSWVPATINQITVSYRLRTLLADWSVFREIREEENSALFIGSESPWFNVGFVICYAAVLLVLTSFVAQTREYPVQSDT